MATIKLYCDQYPNELMLINSDAPNVHIINAALGETDCLARFESKGVSAAMDNFALLTLIHNIDRTLRSRGSGSSNVLDIAMSALKLTGNMQHLAADKYKPDRVIATLKSLRKLANFCISRDRCLLIERYHEDIDFFLTGF